MGIPYLPFRLAVIYSQSNIATGLSSQPLKIWADLGVDMKKMVSLCQDIITIFFSWQQVLSLLVILGTYIEIHES